ncbi:MAG TPA: BrnT family toxin [Rhizomicrobium sp.]|jgi:hypothetical protein|nr:BrnT family toxin [Rhizomicrobium sp.]
MTDFDWDNAKAAANLRKHGVSFDTASKVFDDPFAIERVDPRSEEYGEERSMIIGYAGGNLLSVIYTDRNEKVRLISARRSARDEYDDYYRENAQE